jgi:phosphatidylserine/phosphatidylglycerophosphate/cardiolipin synthase-like enzyme
VSETYIKAASRLDWLLEQIEEELVNNQDSAVNFDFIKRLKGDRLPTKDELLAAFEALSSVDVLIREQSVYKVNRLHLPQKLAYCRGVRDALNNSASREKINVKLCAALPVALNEQVEKALRRNTVDMRASIVDIIASSKKWVALVSPFWDEETAREIAEVLSRRLETGVRVDILGRFEKNDEALPILRQAIGGHKLCQFFAWAQRDSKDTFGKQTFHFKAVVCDDGARAYLGTANLNRAGLRSRMELGVILEGKTAKQLAQIVKVTLSISQTL